MKNCLLTAVAAVAVLLGSTLSAQAQTTPPAFELGVGYQLLRAGDFCPDDDDDDGCEGMTLPLGAAVDVVGNFGAFGIVGEFGWSRDSEEFDAIDLKETVDIYHLAGGVRWSGRANPRVTPYGQFLVGVAWDRFKSEFDGDEDSDTVTDFLIQPGVGVTFAASDSFGVFGQVDYRRMFLDEDDWGTSGRNDFRVFVGVRFMSR